MNYKYDMCSCSKAIKAPLCYGCVSLLKPMFDIFRLEEINTTTERCVWCQRKPAVTECFLQRKSELWI